MFLQAGDCLLFYQEAFLPFFYVHEARNVTSGHKYAARTMIEYMPKKASLHVVLIISTNLYLL